jgi:proline dehydrogenase
VIEEAAPFSIPFKSSKLQQAVVAFLLFLVISAGLLHRFGESWLKHLLLYLSTAVWARNLVCRLSLAQSVARRFVAGETMDEAVAVARDLNGRGMRVAIDYLGESVSNLSEAQAARDEILRLMDRIEQERLDANVSVKLSQLGLKVNADQAYENMRLLAARAKEHNKRVRIDMEESGVVDVTFDIYRRLRFEDGFDNVGVVIQSYLYRTAEDARRLIADGASIRLCKGAYMEPADVAYPLKKEVDQSFVSLMQTLLGEEARRNGVYLGVATHDEKMIAATREFVRAQGIAANEFEFQMLYGVRRDLQEALVDQGHQVRVYVPYGAAWYPYFVRRLAERPANLWFFLSNFFRQ